MCVKHRLSIETHTHTHTHQRLFQNKFMGQQKGFKHIYIYTYSQHYKIESSEGCPGEHEGGCSWLLTPASSISAGRAAFSPSLELLVGACPKCQRTTRFGKAILPAGQGGASPLLELVSNLLLAWKECDRGVRSVSAWWSHNFLDLSPGKNPALLETSLDLSQGKALRCCEARVQTSQPNFPTIQGACS